MTLSRYIAGFLWSLALTLLAYVSVTRHVAMGNHLLLLLGGLAILQAIVQLVFFLHLGTEASSRYKLVSLLVMLVTLLIVIVGSLWIMHHLNYNMIELSPNAKSNLMFDQYDKGGF